MWIIFGLIASAFWGLTYTLSEKIYAKVSITTSLGITSILSGILVLVFAYFNGLLGIDFGTISNSKRLIWLLAGETIALTLAEVFIGLSITHQNATLAGLIEISYPIFIALFTYLIFRESQIDTSTIIGGAVIFLGIFIIYYFH